MDKIEIPWPYIVVVCIGGGSYNETSTPDLAFLRHTLGAAQKLAKDLYNAKESMNLKLAEDEVNIHICQITAGNLDPLDVLYKELDRRGAIKDDNEEEEDDD